MNGMTWHCEIILRNDENCYDDIKCIIAHVMTHVYHDSHGRAYEDQNRVRIYILAQYIRAYVEEITDAGNEHGGYSPMAEELICGALQEVNFREIAEDLIGDYHQESPAEVAEREEYFNVMGFGNYDIDED